VRATALIGCLGTDFEPFEKYAAAHVSRVTVLKIASGIRRADAVICVVGCLASGSCQDHPMHLPRGARSRLTCRLQVGGLALDAWVGCWRCSAKRSAAVRQDPGSWLHSWLDGWWLRTAGSDGHML
jgi:hypothetical protein